MLFERVSTVAELPIADDEADTLPTDPGVRNDVLAVTLPLLTWRTPPVRPVSCPTDEKELPKEVAVTKPAPPLKLLALSVASLPTLPVFN